MLYESLGVLPKLGERLRLTGGCWRALLPLSPGEPSGDPFARYFMAAFSLQRIFPDFPYARPGPLTPTVGQKSGREQLAGDILDYGSKHGPTTPDSTEVVILSVTP